MGRVKFCRVWRIQPAIPSPRQVVGMIFRAPSFFATTIDRLCIAIVERAERTALRQFERALILDSSLPAAGPQSNNVLAFQAKREPSNDGAVRSSGELGWARLTRLSLVRASAAQVMFEPPALPALNGKPPSPEDLMLQPRRAIRQTGPNPQARRADQASSRLGVRLLGYRAGKVFLIAA